MTIPDIIKALEEAVSEQICIAANKHIKRVVDIAGHPGWDWTTQDIADAFKAGAEWMKEKDTRDMYMSDNRHYEKVYELGKKDMKKNMLEDAVEGVVIKTILLPRDLFITTKVRILNFQIT